MYTVNDLTLVGDRVIIAPDYSESYRPSLVDREGVVVDLKISTRDLNDNIRSMMMNDDWVVAVRFEGIDQPQTIKVRSLLRIVGKAIPVTSYKVREQTKYITNGKRGNEELDNILIKGNSGHGISVMYYTPERNEDARSLYSARN